jgi:hypothetical protein
MVFSQIDPNVVREQLVPALSDEGMVSDSKLSTLSTPLLAPQYNPWVFIQTSNVFGGRCGVIANSQASTRSSPSHQPVPLPLFSQAYHRRRRHENSQGLPPVEDSSTSMRQEYTATRHKFRIVIG